MTQAGKTKYRSVAFLYIAAALIYSVTVLELETGELPTKHGPSLDGSKSPYFFWTFITIQFIGCTLLVGRAVYNQLKLKDVNNSTTGFGRFISNRTANLIAAAFIFLSGSIFLILPIVEISNRITKGGKILHNYRLDTDANLFWQEVGLHIFLGFLPILASILLGIFNFKSSKNLIK